MTTAHAAAPPGPSDIEEDGGGFDDSPIFVRVLSRWRGVVITADAAVDADELVVVDGPHVSRRDGDALVIESRRPAGLDSPASRLSRLLVGRPPSMEPVHIRVHPDAAVEFDVTRANLRVEAANAAVTGRAVASVLHVDAPSGPVDLDIVAGSATITSAMRRGDSRVSVKAGTVRIHTAGNVLLQPTSRLIYRSRAAHRHSRQLLPGIDVAGTVSPSSSGYLLGATPSGAVDGVPRLELHVSAATAFIDSRP